MWAASLLVFLANPLLGTVLLMAAAVTQGLKVAKVDAELAKQGKAPASYGLVEAWLNRRKAQGKAPADAKPPKYGMWRYAWMRWRALWEDAAETFQDTRDQYKKAKARARANGTPPPPKPTVKETLTGWKWQLKNPGEQMTGNAQATRDGVPQRPGDRGPSLPLHNLWRELWTPDPAPDPHRPDKQEPAPALA